MVAVASGAPVGRHDWQPVTPSRLSSATCQSLGRRPVLSVIALNPVIRRDAEREDEVGRVACALLEQDLLDHDERRCRFQLVDEPPDVAVPPGQHERRGNLASGLSGWRSGVMLRRSYSRFTCPAICRAVHR